MLPNQNKLTSTQTQRVFEQRLIGDRFDIRKFLQTGSIYRNTPIDSMRIGPLTGDSDKSFVRLLNFVRFSQRRSQTGMDSVVHIHGDE